MNESRKVQLMFYDDDVESVEMGFPAAELRVSVVRYSLSGGDCRERAWLGGGVFKGLFWFWAFSLLLDNTLTVV